MISQLLRKIESDEFAVQVNIASTLSAFRECVEQQQAFKKLVRELSGNALVGHAVLARINTLGKREFDNAYENPHDAALASYLLALEITASTELLPSARHVAHTENLWWARSIASKILRENAQVNTQQDVAITSSVSPLTWEVRLRRDALVHCYVPTEYVISLIGDPSRVPLQPVSTLLVAQDDVDREFLAKLAEPYGRKPRIFADVRQTVAQPKRKLLAV